MCLHRRGYTDDGRPILFYAKALYDYSATIDEEFDFRAGDVIAVTDTPGNGWWSGELVDERRRQPGRHVFPSNYVLTPRGVPPPPTGMYTDDGQPILFYVKALHDYSATNDEEFDFKAGDIIAVTDTPGDGWWRGELVDDTQRQPGRHVFPSNFVSAPREVPPPPTGTHTDNVGIGQSPIPSARREQSPPPNRIYTDDGRPILFHAKALYDYSATIDEEFDFKAGDVIAVTDTPEDGWWRGELVDDTRRQPGRCVFPSNFVSAPRKKPPPPLPLPTRMYTDDGRLILFYVKALYDYAATIDEEFDFHAGDIIGVTDSPEDGWWSGELLDETRKEAGRDVFPRNFVSLL